MERIYKLSGILLICCSLFLVINWLPAKENHMTIKEAVATLGIDEIEKQLSQQGDKISTLAKYCKGKLRTSEKSFTLLREEGWTIDEAIEDLKYSRLLLEDQGNYIPQSIYLEYERMARTIDRHPEKPKEELQKRFFSECLVSGY